VSVGTLSPVDANLEIGSVKETVTVTSQKPATAPAAAPAGTPHRIRVGGNVQPLRLIRQARPEYPADAKQQGVEGTVLVRAVISKTGQVLKPEVINTDVDPRLAKAALDAVSQWRYEPTLLNGQPVETLATITLEFNLQQ
jgi:protein TonB